MSAANPLLLPSMQVATLAQIDPQNLAPGSVQTPWIDMANVQYVMAHIAAGAFAAGGTLDAKMRQATDNAGAGAKDVAGKAITQMVQADANKQVKINLHTSELDVNNGFNHVQLDITVGTAAVDVSAELQGHYQRYGPGNELNAASVKEIIE